MDISQQVALVTGANRGFGRVIAAELLARGAKVYATARNPDTIDLLAATPLRLDVTDLSTISAAAGAATDVTLVINNAGSSTGADLLTGSLADIRLELETHFLGSLSVIRAFAPILAENGGGAVVNILSVLSWISFPKSGAYAAAKSAEWSMTNALRIALARQGTRVAGVHVGYMDTDMTASIDADKHDPTSIAKIVVDGIEADAYEILADDLSKQVQANLANGVAELYPKLP